MKKSIFFIDQSKGRQIGVPFCFLCHPISWKSGENCRNWLGKAEELAENRLEKRRKSPKLAWKSGKIMDEDT